MLSFQGLVSQPLFYPTLNRSPPIILSNLEPVNPHDYLLFRRVLDELPGGYIVKTQPAELKTMVVFATAEVDGLIISA